MVLAQAYKRIRFHFITIILCHFFSTLFATNDLFIPFNVTNHIVVLVVLPPPPPQLKMKQINWRYIISEVTIVRTCKYLKRIVAQREWHAQEHDTFAEAVSFLCAHKMNAAKSDAFNSSLKTNKKCVCYFFFVGPQRTWMRECASKKEDKKNGINLNCTIVKL